MKEPEKIGSGYAVVKYSKRFERKEQKSCVHPSCAGFGIVRSSHMAVEAMRFSREYMVDIDIVDEKLCRRVILYLWPEQIEGSMKKRLVALLEYCDELQFAVEDGRVTIHCITPPAELLKE